VWLMRLAPLRPAPARMRWNASFYSLTFMQPKEYHLSALNVMNKPRARSRQQVSVFCCICEHRTSRRSANLCAQARGCGAPLHTDNCIQQQIPGKGTGRIVMPCGQQSRCGCPTIARSASTCASARFVELPCTQTTALDSGLNLTVET
jgi:hypothetical protein